MLKQAEATSLNQERTLMKIALYAGVLLVFRVVGPRRLGQSVAVKINSKAQGSKEFHRTQEDAW